MKLNQFTPRERFELAATYARSHLRRSGFRKHFRLTNREIDELEALIKGMTEEQLERVQVRSRAVRVEILKIFQHFESIGLNADFGVGISKDKAGRWLRELEEEEAEDEDVAPELWQFVTRITRDDYARRAGEGLLRPGMNYQVVE